MAFDMALVDEGGKMEKEYRKKRQSYIIKNLGSGKKSMVQLAFELGISRERVSQIYYKAIGETERGSLLIARRERQEEQRENWLDSAKFLCASCGIPVSHREGKYLHKYCLKCHDIGKKERRIMRITFICSTCKKSFHPFYNSTNKNKVGHFCSRECYHNYPKG